MSDTRENSSDFTIDNLLFRPTMTAMFSPTSWSNRTENINPQAPSHNSGTAAVSSQKRPHQTTSLPTYFLKHGSKSSLNENTLASKSASTRTLARRKKSMNYGSQEALAAKAEANTASSRQQISSWSMWNRWVTTTLEFFPYSSIRARVKLAMKEGKIFTVTSGAWYTVRRSLNRRGWVEKPKLNVFDFGVETQANGELRSISDAFLGGRLRDVSWAVGVLQNYQPNLVWNMGFFNPKTFRRGQILNRQPKPLTSFHTKVGMVAISQCLHWYQEEQIAVTLIPRCYRLFISEELASFVGDFCLTACMGLLKFIVGALKHRGIPSIIDESGTVSADSIQLVIQHIDSYINMRENADIDTSRSRPVMGNLDRNAEKLMETHHKVVHMRSKLSLSSAFPDVQTLYAQSERALKNVAQYWPQLKMDGTHNLWICKPGYQMRGNGVTVKNDLQKILDLLGTKTFKGSDSDWVVQKYIERPLLIFSTKFDIRQWFVVTSFNPLAVWFYRECYLRFCSKPFATEDFDERIHLCNSAVQSKYSYTSKDTNLPKSKIWDNYTFQAYLKTIGQSDVWDEVILPGMKQALVGVLLASQDVLFQCPRTCFQLYGADFMLSENFQPWLIEINNLPLLCSSCHTLARMSKAVLEDTLKVVLDYPQNSQADTGLFELIFRQQPMNSNWRSTDGEFVVKGRRVACDSGGSRNETQTRGTSAISLEVEHSVEPIVNPPSFASGALILSRRFHLQDPPKIPRHPAGPSQEKTSKAQTEKTGPL